jgi:hypothetical protein
LTWTALVSLNGAATFSALGSGGGVTLACCAPTAHADAKMIVIPKIGFFIPIVLHLS